MNQVQCSPFFVFFLPKHILPFRRELNGMGGSQCARLENMISNFESSQAFYEPHVNFLRAFYSFGAVECAPYKSLKVHFKSGAVVRITEPVNQMKRMIFESRTFIHKMQDKSVFPL